jgi:diguanylate cyclase (GGDEF)-like protein/PAS domain S-box-containing protein
VAEHDREVLEQSAVPVTAFRSDLNPGMWPALVRVHHVGSAAWLVVLCLTSAGDRWLPIAISAVGVVAVGVVLQLAVRRTGRPPTWTFVADQVGLALGAAAVPSAAMTTAFFSVAALGLTAMFARRWLVATMFAVFAAGTAWTVVESGRIGALSHAVAVLTAGGSVAVSAHLVSRALHDVNRHQQRIFETMDAVAWREHPSRDGAMQVSVAAEEMLGYPGEAWSTTDFWRSICHPDDLARVEQSIDDHRDRRGQYTVTFRMRHADGTWRWIENRVTSTDGDGDEQRLYLGVMVDRTERVNAEHELHERATHDGLTGLLNRQAFVESVDAMLATRVPEHVLAVMLLDLNQFKEVNDALGHPVGDQLLRHVAARLCARLDEHPTELTIGRLGGDEFAVACELPTLDAAIELAGAIVGVLDVPFSIDDLSIRSTASIGVAVAPHHGMSSKSLVRAADVAMYGAKHHGGGARLYTPSNDGSSRRRVQLLGDLRQAIEDDGFELWYQPIMDLRTGRTKHIEALLRWPHPELGMVWPMEFIELAEVSGLIRPLTRWVLATALEDAHVLARAGLELGISCNLSARNLHETDLVEWIEQQLEMVGQPRGGLILELTETGVLEDREVGQQVLDRLAAIGVKSWLDDFGTGYSSLIQLRHLPFSAIKIDRSFVTGFPDRPDDEAIVASVIGLARRLGLEVVAEGVEDEATLARLDELGCDLAQGYLVGRPLPLSELLVQFEQSAALLGPAG